jgi:hypothetical protein
LRIAVRTRSRLSRTAESGSPTVMNAGNPAVTSTSTRTRAASTPRSAAERTWASTVGILRALATARQCREYRTAQDRPHRWRHAGWQIAADRCPERNSGATRPTQEGHSRHPSRRRAKGGAPASSSRQRAKERWWEPGGIAIRRGPSCTVLSRPTTLPQRQPKLGSRALAPSGLLTSASEVASSAVTQGLRWIWHGPPLGYFFCQ